MVWRALMARRICRLETLGRSDVAWEQPCGMQASRTARANVLQHQPRWAQAHPPRHHRVTLQVTIHGGAVIPACQARAAVTPASGGTHMHARTHPHTRTPAHMCGHTCGHAPGGWPSLSLFLSALFLSWPRGLGWPSLSRISGCSSPGRTCARACACACARVRARVGGWVGGWVGRVIETEGN